MEIPETSFAVVTTGEDDGAWYVDVMRMTKVDIVVGLRDRSLSPFPVRFTAVAEPGACLVYRT